MNPLAEQGSGCALQSCQKCCCSLCNCCTRCETMCACFGANTEQLCWYQFYFTMYVGNIVLRQLNFSDIVVVVVVVDISPDRRVRGWFTPWKRAFTR